MNREEAFLEFLKNFREYLVKYVNENQAEFKIYEHEVGAQPITLFQDQNKYINLTLKNEGNYPVLLTTDMKSKFTLEPGEKEKLHINVPLTLICLDGESKVSFIEG